MPFQQRLIEIQLLRGVAALAVVLHHAADRAGLSFGVGAAGVDIFFVISGFIMWMVGTDRPASPLRFAWARLARVAPLYWLVTIGIAALALLLPAAMPNLHPTPQTLLLSLFFIPHRNAEGAIFPLLVPGWTLNFEMVFYLLFAASLALPRQARLGMLLATLGLLATAGLALQPDHPVAVTCTSPLLLEFAGGIGLAVLWRQGRLPGRAGGWSMMALGFGAFAALELNGFHAEDWRVLLWGVPAWLLVAGALSAGAVGRHGPAALLGDASYSIYLMHPLLVGLTWRLLGWLPVPAYLAVTLLLSISAGLACFRLVELPISRRLRLHQRARLHPSHARGAPSSTVVLG
ncbi:acyltransferase [Roseicella sp. DB1501]|uniref:acyltransferase family protein n=1 Tax=Roseicella sp. DB1501 TaxID=2730925 RepID=UPI001492EA18|nr:acyltransferase [Roseicella sp. DB1501]NOG72935.1 acyltransferase [Roseicella sp. DB1501]